MSSSPPSDDQPESASPAPEPEPTTAPPAPVPAPAPAPKESIDTVLERARAAHASGEAAAAHDALGEMISWVQQLSGQLATAFRERAEMETSLTLTRSNLQMAIANNEMLEDALRNRGTSRDVGWRRSRPPGDPILEAASSTSTPPNSAAFPASPNPHPPPPPPQQKEGRFLSRFRFGSSSPQQQQSSPISPRPPAHSHSVDDASFHPPTPSGSSNGTNHLTSASLPYLPLDPPVPQAPSRNRLESAPSLRAELQKERAARAAIEAELESLSAALFEEANKMVADERRSKAEIMEELRTVSQQRDALKAALRVVEQENGVLRGGEWTPAHSRPGSVASIRDDAPTPPTHFNRDDIRPRSASLASVRSTASNGSVKHKPTPLKETPRAPQASEPERVSPGGASDDDGDGDDDVSDRREDGYQVLAVEHVVDDMQTPRVNGAFVHAQ